MPKKPGSGRQPAKKGQGSGKKTGKKKGKVGDAKTLRRPSIFDEKTIVRKPKESGASRKKTTAKKKPKPEAKPVEKKVTAAEVLAKKGNFVELRLHEVKVLCIETVKRNPELKDMITSLFNNGLRASEMKLKELLEKHHLPIEKITRHHWRTVDTIFRQWELRAETQGRINQLKKELKAEKEKQKPRKSRVDGINFELEKANESLAKHERNANYFLDGLAGRINLNRKTLEIVLNAEWGARQSRRRLFELFKDIFGKDFQYSFKPLKRMTQLLPYIKPETRRRKKKQ